MRLHGQTCIAPRSAQYSSKIDNGSAMDTAADIVSISERLFVLADRSKQLALESEEITRTFWNSSGNHSGSSSTRWS